MRILILGAGVVGYNIAARLVQEQHDVTLIDRDPTILGQATDDLDVKGLVGNCALPKTLDHGDIANTHMLIAVTDSDEVNLLACYNAAALGTRDLIKIARVREPGYSDARLTSQSHFPVDLIINPERVTADRILALLRYPDVTEMLEFADGKVEIIGMTVIPTSPLAGLRLMDLGDRFFRTEFLVAAIDRADRIIIPSGRDVILPGDELYIVVRASEIEAAFGELGIKTTPVSRVLILGGSRIGEFVATDLSARGLKPKIIEPDPSRAQQLSHALADTVVLNGNPSEPRILQEENIDEMQAVVACMTSEEINVMAALLARRMGAQRIIATSNRADYKPLMKATAFDACLSPRQVAVSSILHFIRHGEVVAVRALGDGYRAEVLEFEAQMASDAVRTPIRDLKIPKGAVIAALVRDGMVLIPRGETIIEERDHVLVVAAEEAVGPIERLLQRRLDRGA